VSSRTHHGRVPVRRIRRWEERGSTAGERTLKGAVERAVERGQLDGG